jgi:hypothetical protein
MIEEDHGVELAAHGGWQRSSVLGKDQADVDLILTQPTIGETAWGADQIPDVSG